jgi:hypothetical protein
MSLLPQQNGLPEMYPTGGMGGLLSGGSPLLNIGLGILANNTGNYGNFGAAIGRGAQQGMQQTQLQAQQALAALQLQNAQDELDKRKKRDAALPRLLQGQEAYTTNQKVPMTSFENVPIAPQEGAQAPNFGLQRNQVTTMQDQPVFNKNTYMQDMVDAGYGEEMLKLQMAPKKVGYRDVGDKLLPYDEATGVPRTDLQPIPKSMTPDAQANLMMRNYEFNNLSAAQRANNDISIRGQNITMRGQNMTDSRARDSNNINAQGKPPTGFRWREDGNLEAIPGGPGEKSANVSEGERKSATLLKRLEGSLTQLNTAIDPKLGGNPKAASPELVPSFMRAATFGALEAAPNVMTSPNRQRVEAAQLDILDAALTLGTGAAYTKEQLEGYRKSYFPQLGDSKKTIEDKQARLANVIDAARVAAGRAAPSGSGVSGGWSIQEVK